MPTAPEYLREMFPDDRCAWNVLKRRFRDDRGLIRPKVAGTIPTRRENYAIDYLCAEWDYGYESVP